MVKAEAPRRGHLTAVLMVTACMSLAIGTPNCFFSQVGLILPGVSLFIRLARKTGRASWVGWFVGQACSTAVSGGRCCVVAVQRDAGA